MKKLITNFHKKDPAKKPDLPPLVPTQSLLLSCAYLHFNDGPALAWTADFFKLLGLICDDLQSFPEAHPLLKEISRELGSTQLTDQKLWQDVSARKAEEGWINQLPPFQFNDWGRAVAQKALSEQWDQDFTEEVPRFFTTEVIKRIKTLTSYYQKIQIGGITEEYKHRFHPNDPY